MGRRVRNRWTRRLAQRKSKHKRNEREYAKKQIWFLQLWCDDHHCKAKCLLNTGDTTRMLRSKRNVHIAHHILFGNPMTNDEFAKRLLEHYNRFKPED